MRTIAILIFTLTISQPLSAMRICQPYIIDEWPDSRYTIETVSGDNVVTDNKTGLMWKQCSEGLSGADCMTSTSSTFNWQEALELPVTLNSNLGFAGHNDWRIPNIEELRSIVAMNCYNPAINEVAFPNTNNFQFWSSSPFANNTSSAWVVGFGGGKGIGAFRSADYIYLRLVRSVQ